MVESSKNKINVALPVFNRKLLVESQFDSNARKIECGLSNCCRSCLIRVELKQLDIYQDSP